MMKKLSLILLALFAPLCIWAQAQPEPNQLTGIWQYVQTDNAGQNVQRFPVWKVMENDYTFQTFILANPEAYSVVTNQGTYHVLSDSVFVEHITGSITDKNLIGKDNRISYVFEGTDTLHVTYRLPGAQTDGQECWVRVKLEYPQ